jgi:hypothetical protein
MQSSCRIEIPELQQVWATKAEGKSKDLLMAAPSKRTLDCQLFEQEGMESEQ